MAIIFKILPIQCKFYEMVISSYEPGIITVRFGRIGAAARYYRYSANMWDRILKAKLAKGYVVIRQEGQDAPKAQPEIHIHIDKELTKELQEWSKNELLKINGKGDK